MLVGQHETFSALLVLLEGLLDVAIAADPTTSSPRKHGDHLDTTLPPRFESVRVRKRTLSARPEVQPTHFPVQCPRLDCGPNRRDARARREDADLADIAPPWPIASCGESAAHRSGELQSVAATRADDPLIGLCLLDQELQRTVLGRRTGYGVERWLRVVGGLGLHELAWLLEGVGYVRRRIDRDEPQALGSLNVFLHRRDMKSDVVAPAAHTDPARPSNSLALQARDDSCKTKHARGQPGDNAPRSHAGRFRGVEAHVARRNGQARPSEHGGCVRGRCQECHRRVLCMASHRPSGRQQR
mmetsp:Transcript_1594/g.3623  ORF Transcript_1594/g.3623 Transcript_1594/m.3623 type:complete len:300 (+) Transcript_1594:210-1109(+)